MNSARAPAPIRPRGCIHMRDYSRSKYSDSALLQLLASHVAADRMSTAELVADIAEVDERRLYLPAGYTSMHAYCVQVLRLSEDAASRRIMVARAARQFPVIFERIADGRLHLTAVVHLAPHLTAENVTALLDLATYKSKRE